MGDQVSGLLSPFLRHRRFAAAQPFLQGRILDFGCGVGILAEAFDPNNYVGIDVDAASIGIAHRLFPLHTFLGSWDFDPTTYQSDFDTVVALAVIEHVADPGVLLGQFRQLLKPGGRVVLSTPDPSFTTLYSMGTRVGLFSREAEAEHHTLLDRRALYQLSAEAGLKLEIYRKFLLGANQLCVLKHV